MHTRRERDKHTRRLHTQSPRERFRQMAFSHVKGHERNSRSEHKFGPSCRESTAGRESHQYKTLLTSGWRAARLTAEEFALDYIKVRIVRGADFSSGMLSVSRTLYRRSVLRSSWRCCPHFDLLNYRSWAQISKNEMKCGNEKMFQWNLCCLDLLF